MAITDDQRREMHEEVRRLRGIGEPQRAVPIQTALANDEYFTGAVAQTVTLPTQPKKTASKEAWVKYAKKVSDFDAEVIEACTRNDLIAMLKANNLLQDS